MPAEMGAQKVDLNRNSSGIFEGEKRKREIKERHAEESEKITRLGERYKEKKKVSRYPFAVDVHFS